MCECGCRQWPDTLVTDAVVDSVDYSDPLFPDNEPVEQRHDEEPAFQQL